MTIHNVVPLRRQGPSPRINDGAKSQISGPTRLLPSQENDK